ncbi:transposase [Rhodovibrio sodomensis]
MQRFSTDEACRAFLERVRWPNGPVCPKCVRSAGRSGVRPGSPAGRVPGGAASARVRRSSP